jgi:hypothetical protein
MSGCCGGSSKSEPAKVATIAAPQTTDAAAEQPAVKSSKSECCDKATKNVKGGCGCC